MDANIKTITEFLGHAKTIFSIPVYQRNYEWDRTQCYQLFHDLEGLIVSPHNHHFLGVIIYLAKLGPNGSFIYHIIDGQQRITSLMLLLSAISTAINDDEKKDDIQETFLINKHLHKNHQLKLKPVEYDYLAYERVIKKTAIDTRPSKMMSNYHYFQRLIQKSPYSPEQLANALNRMNIVKIELDDDSSSENPQKIFEAINSTGISLTDADLIRNFLFMNVSLERQNDLYHDYWIPIEHLLSDGT